MRNIYAPLILIFLKFSPLNIIGQSIQPSVIASSGGSISDSTTILNWTLGETTIQNIQDGLNSLSQGFHQPYYTVVPVVENSNLLFDVKIFPNPSTDILYIKICSETEVFVEISIFDINGRSIYQKKEAIKIKHETVTFDTKNFAATIYFIKLTNIEKNISEIFQIQRNH